MTVHTYSFRVRGKSSDSDFTDLYQLALGKALNFFFEATEDDLEIQLSCYETLHFVPNDDGTVTRVDAPVAEVQVIYNDSEDIEDDKIEFALTDDDYSWRQKPGANNTYIGPMGMPVRTLYGISEY